MHKAGRSRSALRVALIGGCLLLAFAVFAWGLGAKLSLYQANVAPSTTTVAKLLTTQKTGRDLVESPPAPPALPDFHQLALVLLAGLIGVPAACLLWLTADIPYGRYEEWGIPAFFSRPPPYAAHADCFVVAS